MGRHKKENVGIASEVPVGAVTPRTQLAPEPLQEPKSSRYVVRHVVNNGIESIKVAEKKEYPGFGVTSTLVARLAKKNGRWEVLSGRMLSEEIRKAIKDAGY